MTDLEQGDRVVLRGLVDAATVHLNGSHGSIALIRSVAAAVPDAAGAGPADGAARGGGVVLAVHLDRLGKTFLIRPEHVVREDPIQKYARQNCATVQDGVLEPIATAALGLPLMRSFAIVRWIVATQYLAKSTNRNHQDYQTLTVQQVSHLPFQRSLELNAYAIQHWNDKHGVRDCLTSFVHHQPPPTTATTPPQQKLFTVEKRFIANALQSPRGMKSWHYGRQGEFWFVGRDDTGSFVVPDQNRAVVYKIVGISRASTAGFKQPGEPVSLHVTPHCMPITIVPWLGRLLYDTTILVPPGQLKRADEPQLAHQLHETVLRAIQKSTAIEYFAELEESI